MRLLAAPEGEDPSVVSGESGAIGMGFIDAVMTDPQYAALRKDVGLDENSVVLMFSTEGATDPDNYRRIVGKDAVDVLNA